MRKIYLIIGASSDVGIELIKQLNKENSDCVFVAHYNSSRRKIEDIELSNNNVIDCIHANLISKEDVDNLVNIVSEKYKSPTHIVHLSAGKFEYEKLKDFSYSKLDADLNIQLYTSIKLFKKFIPKMLKGETKGKIVFVLTSNTISTPPKYTTRYNVVKYAMLGLMKSLASDYAGKNICINAISPSMVNTKFLSEIDARLIEMAAESSVGKIIAEPKDIVAGISFLLSEKSDYITGVNLNVSNGNVM